MNPIIALLAAAWLSVLVAAAAPANDNLAAAQLIEPSPQLVTGTTVGSTEEAGETNGGYYPFHSVWYKWTPTESSGWEIEMINPGNGDGMIIYRGTTFQNFLPVGYADWSGSNSVWVEGGVTYYFQVRAGAREGAPFSFRFTRGPANDAFEGRTPLPSEGGVFDISMVGATVQPNDPGYANSFGRTLWWSWVPSRTSSYYFSFANFHLFGPEFSVFQGNTITGLTPVPTERVFGNGELNTIFLATAWEVYSVRLSTVILEPNPVHFTLREGPPNDEWERAQAIGALGSAVSGNTIGATYQAGEPVRQTRGGGTIWFFWEVPATGSYVARMSANGGHGNVTVYRGESLASLVSLPQTGHDYDLSGESHFPFRANAGERLYVAVDPEDTSRGPFTLSILRPAANDDFAAAERLEGAYPSAALRPFVATAEPGEPGYVGIGNDGSLWWRWTAPRTGSVLVQSEHDDKRVGLGVYTGTSLENLTRVTGQTNWAWTLFAGFHAVEGQEYFIHLLHDPGTSASARISLQPGAWNDDIASAETISAPMTGTGRLRVPTLEPDEPLDLAGNGTLWWKWTAPASGSYSWSARSYTEGNGIEVAVFSGATRAEMQLVGRAPTIGSEAVLAFRAAQGETFHFMMAAAPNIRPEERYFGYQFEIGPPNDDFANATEITSLPSLVRSTTRGATREPGEPQPWNLYSGASVWFKWVAPFTGRVLAGTDGADGRAYAGTALENLQPLPEGELSSNERWLDVVEGTQYYFAAESSPTYPGPVAFRLGLPPANGSYETRERIEEVGITHRSWTLFTDYGRNVWWTWTAREDGLLTVQTSPAAPASLTRIYHQEPFVVEPALMASWTNRVAVVAGRTYDIQVSTTYESAEVSVTLQFLPQTAPWSDPTLLRSGTSHWFEQTSEFHTGPTAMQAGPLGRFDASWMQRTFMGPGRVSFWWKRNVEIATLAFDIVLLPGQRRYFTAVQAQGGWTRVEAPLNYGTNVVRWLAQRASYFPAEAIAVPAFVDDVVFTPDVIELLEPRWTAGGLEVGLRADVGHALTTWYFESSSDLRTWSAWTTRQVDSRPTAAPYEVRATYVPPAGQQRRFFRVRR